MILIERPAELVLTIVVGVVAQLDVVVLEDQIVRDREARLGVVRLLRVDAVEIAGENLVLTRLVQLRALEDAGVRVDDEAVVLPLDDDLDVVVVVVRRNRSELAGAVTAVERGVRCRGLAWLAAIVLTVRPRTVRHAFEVRRREAACRTRVGRLLAGELLLCLRQRETVREVVDRLVAGIVFELRAAEDRRGGGDRRRDRIGELRELRLHRERSVERDHVTRRDGWRCGDRIPTVARLIASRRSVRSLNPFGPERERVAELAGGS